MIANEQHRTKVKFHLPEDTADKEFRRNSRAKYLDPKVLRPQEWQAI